MYSTALDYYHYCNLIFAKSWFLLYCIIILFLIYKSEKAFFIILAVTFSILLNAYLKSIWRVPLNPALNKIGWAFPSGHTQTAALFWMMVAFWLKNWKSTVLIVIMLLNNFNAMIYFGYHTWEDILAALCVAGILLVIFYHLYKTISYHINAYFRFACLIILASLFIIALLPHHLQNYTWTWQIVAIQLLVCIYIRFTWKIGACENRHC